jgi:PIN domain nuclease of toxin-antitoxin system
MRLLLDTVAIYKAATAPERLSSRARQLISAPSTELFVTIVSAWELVIKASLDKLALPAPIEAFFTQITADLLAKPIVLDLRALSRLAELPQHHADPFDRLIIAQALAADCAVLTSDKRFRDYEIDVVW